MKNKKQQPKHSQQKPAKKSANNLAMGCMVAIIILAITLHILITFLFQLF
jgi:hypothetical protein